MLMFGGLTHEDVFEELCQKHRLNAQLNELMSIIPT